MRTLQSGHDVLPFLKKMLPAGSIRLAPLPSAMMDQLQTSPDFASMHQGEPMWIALAVSSDAADEIILNRAEAAVDIKLSLRSQAPPLSPRRS